MRDHQKKRGYTFSLDHENHIMKVVAWGFWDVAFAKQYDQALREKIKEISQNGTQEFSVLVDLDQYPAQNDEVQAIAIDGMKFGVQHKLKREARIIGKALTKMQLARLVKEAGMPENSTFQSERDALEWLLRDS